MPLRYNDCLFDTLSLQREIYTILLNNYKICLQNCLHLPNFEALVLILSIISQFRDFNR